MLNHNYIGTEHILPRPDPRGRRRSGEGTGSLNISLDAVRQQVEEMIGQGQQAPAVTSRSPPCQEGAGALLREALQLGHNTSAPSTSCWV